jgi:hypothetical protein
MDYLCMPGGYFWQRTSHKGQPVEKVAADLSAASNRARSAPQAACLVPDLGVKASTKGVFQHAGTMRSSQNAQKAKFAEFLFHALR